MTIHMHRQIDKLKRQILSLGAKVEEAVESAIRAVHNRDLDLAQQVINKDQEIDQMEIDVEEECLHTLALHQPVAFDLRYIVSVLKINNELERIGDLAVNIAEQAEFLAREARLEAVPYDLPKMTERVRAMLNGSLDALVNVDTQAAQRVRETDDEVDEMYRQTYNAVEEAIRQDPTHLPQLIHFLNIARQLERTADHTTNVAEDVLYMAEGEIYRHHR